MNKQPWIVILILAAAAGAQAKSDPNRFDPDNAAHWYRKAFKLYEEPNDFDLSDYAVGNIELTPEIETFLTDQQPVIDLLIKATKIDHCDWKFDPLANGTYALHPYISDVKKAAILLLAKVRHKDTNASTLTILNDFKPVLQLASHIDSEILLNHLVSLALRGMSYNAIREYLNRHSDLQLTDLYRVLSFITNESSRASITFKDTIKGDIQYTTRILTNYKTYIYSDQYLTEQIGLPAKKLSADFYRRNLEFYIEYMRKLQPCLDLPYPQTVQKINELEESLNEDFRNHFVEYKDILEKKAFSFDTPILAGIDVEPIEKCDFFYTAITTPCSPQILSIDTRIRTQLNALETAIELLIRHQTSKKLPTRLPFNSPKDLFSDKPFQLVKTKNGFKLISEGANYTGDKRELYEYEFVLPKIEP